MSKNESTLSIDAISFTPRLPTNHLDLHNLGQNMAGSWIINVNSFANQGFRLEEQLYNIPAYPILNSSINTQSNPQLIYTWPHPYTFPSYNIPYTNLPVSDHNIINYNSIPIGNDSIQSFNKTKINKNILPTKPNVNKIKNDENTGVITSDDKSILNKNIETRDHNNITDIKPLKIYPHETQQIKKKKRGKSFICLEEYQNLQEKNPNSQNINKKPDSLTAVNHSTNSTFEQSDATNKSPQNLMPTNKNILKNVLFSHENLLYNDTNLNISENNKIDSNCTKNKKDSIINKANKEEIENSNLEKPKISYSAIVKNTENFLKKQKKISVNSNIKVISNIHNYNDKNNRLECNKTDRNLNNNDKCTDDVNYDPIKNLASTENHYKDDNYVTSNKNKLGEGKLLFQEWKKYKNTDMDKNNFQHSLIFEQVAHISSRNKMSQSVKKSKQLISNQPFTENVTESEDNNINNETSKKDMAVESKISEIWLELKNKKKIKNVSPKTKESDQSIIKNLNEKHHFRTNTESIDKIQNIKVFKNISEPSNKKIYLPNSKNEENINIDKNLNKYKNFNSRNIVKNNLTETNSYKYEKYNITSGGVKNISDNKIANTSNAFSNTNKKQYFKISPIDSNFYIPNNNYKLINKSSKIDYVDSINESPKIISYASALSNKSFKNIKSASSIKSDNQRSNIPKNLNMKDDFKLQITRKSKEQINNIKDVKNFTDKRLVMKKINTNKNYQPRYQSQPPITTRLSETPILLDIFDHIKINKQTKNETKLKFKNMKKEKSTDCDSALIPLLCVHG